LIAAFADDAMQDDARREFQGVDAIKRCSDRVIHGPKPAMAVARRRT